tara:strand:- start:3238 stop:3561 length:324 start_codon:yes stop_codon:yes gene_type:complete
MNKFTKFIKKMAKSLKSNLDNKEAIQYMYNWLTLTKGTTTYSEDVEGSKYDVRNPKGRVFKTKIRMLTNKEIRRANKQKDLGTVADRKRGVQLRKVQNYLERKHRLN